MSAAEFSGIGFAPGVVRGTRSFDVDRLGRLTGVSFKQVWTPGENTAVCRKEEARGWGSFVVGGSSRWSYTFGAITATPSTASTEVTKAAALALGKAPQITKAVEDYQNRDDLTTCSHGFYAYYEGSNDYYEPGRVMAVVEGYGETVVGTRGFRSMKARIVALHIPEDVVSRHANFVQRNYPEVPFFDSFDAMIAAFPPDDAGMEPSPENDPEFWTRSI